MPAERTMPGEYSPAGAISKKTARYFVLNGTQLSSDVQRSTWNDAGKRARLLTAYRPTTRAACLRVQTVVCTARAPAGD